jgi:predicted DNA-binding transcriptional regulator AlpA
MEKKDLITLNEARSLLGVSRMKIWRLVKEGSLTAIPNKLDKREKLVSKSEVLSLVPNRAEAA